MSQTLGTGRGPERDMEEREGSGRAVLCIELVLNEHLLE